MGTRQNYWTIHLSLSKCPLINLTDIPSVNPTADNSCDDSILCSEEVYNLLHSLDTTKSNGDDDISAIMLQNTALSITEAVTKMFNISISLGKLPDEWKISCITPIPRHGDHTSPSNYCPISLLSILAKQTSGETHGTITHWTHGSKQSSISSSMGVL